MQAVLTLFKDSKSFQPVTRHRPVGMLPVLNRPILEWHIMNCVRSGITRILIIAVENPLTVGEFVGPGSRWGASIEMLVYKDPYGPRELLARISGMIQDTVVIIPADAIINLPYESFLNFHDNAKGKITRVSIDGQIEFVANDASLGCFRKLELESRETGAYIADVGSVNSSDVIDYLWDGNFMSLETPKDLWMANMAALAGCFADFFGPVHLYTSRSEPQIGHHTHIDSTAVLRTPCLIGDYCRVNAGVRISRFSIIGDGVIVDQGATVGSSLICDDTYIGTDTNIENCIVMANVMINMKVGSWTSVGDPFLLSGVKKKILYSFSEKLMDKILAFLLLMMTAPIWVITGLIRKVRRKSFFEVHQLMMRDLYFDPASKNAARAKNFFWFDDSGPFVERIPGLIDVILGKLRLVGVRPLKEEEFERYQEDWALQRFEALDGLFTPVDAYCPSNVSEDERITAENYYTATRSLKEDLRILVKSIKNLLIRD